jgi:hypothetical protein
MLISAINFAKQCGIVLDTFYNPQLIVNKSLVSDYVFVTIEDNVFEKVLHFLKSFKNKYNIIFHRSDKTFDRFYFESIKPYVKHIYATNCEIEHPLITKIPIGFADNKIPKKISCKKDIKCYLNLGLYNDKEVQFVKCRSIRLDCINRLKNKNFITYDEKPIPFDDFQKKINRSQFVICPPGYGLDTHRFYETCYLGGTPITLSSGLDSLHKKYGALIIEDWDEVTEELLDNFKYEKVSDELFDTCMYL